MNGEQNAMRLMLEEETRNDPESLDKQTPGTWKASSVFIENAPNRWVVSVAAWGGPSIADCGAGEANAKLISASPELLKSLIDIVEIARNRWRRLPTDTPEKQRLHNAYAAIAKARGE